MVLHIYDHPTDQNSHLLQTKAFCKFLPVIIVLYLGFLTTFTMLARDRLTLNEMSWILIKVFFGYVWLALISTSY